MSAAQTAITEGSENAPGDIQRYREVAGHLIYDLPREDHYLSRYNHPEALQPDSKCVRCKKRSRENFLAQHPCKRPNRALRSNSAGF